MPEPTSPYPHLPLEADSPDESALLEQLAAEQHASWARYVAYLLDKGTWSANGAITLTPSYVAALRQLCATHYADLDEPTKEFDRREVRRAMPAIRDFIRQLLDMPEGAMRCPHCRRLLRGEPVRVSDKSGAVQWRGCGRCFLDTAWAEQLAHRLADAEPIAVRFGSIGAEPLPEPGLPAPHDEPLHTVGEPPRLPPEIVDHFDGQTH